jgi:hypothetical protein
MGVRTDDDRRSAEASNHLQCHGEVGGKIVLMEHVQNDATNIAGENGQPYHVHGNATPSMNILNAKHTLTSKLLQ